MPFAANCSATPRHRQGDPQHVAECLDPNQGDLFAEETVQDEGPSDLTSTFLAFHAANPHVYLTLRELAREWRAQGKTKCGITLLYNTARWRRSLRTEGEGMFELNDHYQAYYARALMRFEADLDGMFDTRRAPAADAWIATYPKGRVA